MVLPRLKRQAAHLRTGRLDLWAVFVQVSEGRNAADALGVKLALLGE
jgi:hypothetical protein